MFVIRVYFQGAYIDLLGDEYLRNRIEEWFYGRGGETIKISQNASTYYFDRKQVSALTVAKS
jgi:hypothetical protein